MEKIHAVTYGSLKEPVLINFLDIYPERMYFNYGNRYIETPADLKILKTYTIPVGKDFYDVLVLFYVDFPPVPTEFKEETDGWLSPDGKEFYECEMGDHNQMSQKLVAVFFKEFGGKWKLINAGWVEVHANGTRYLLVNGEPEYVEKD